MTYARMVELVSQKTGLPEKMIRQVLDVQSSVIATCMVNQEEVHFPRLLKLHAEQRSFTWKDKSGKRIILRVRPMKPLRRELNKWTSSHQKEPDMEKYGVTTDEAQAKIASKEGRSCPGCGGKNVNYAGSTPHCPNCGTRPWESRGNDRDSQR